MMLQRNLSMFRLKIKHKNLMVQVTEQRQEGHYELWSICIANSVLNLLPGPAQMHRQQRERRAKG